MMVEAEMTACSWMPLQAPLEVAPKSLMLLPSWSLTSTAKFFLTPPPYRTGLSCTCLPSQWVTVHHLNRPKS